MTNPAGGPVPTYVLLVRLNRQPSDAELKKLGERDDKARFERDGQPSMVRVTRTVETLSVAVAEALEDVATVPELSPLWVEPDDAASSNVRRSGGPGDGGAVRT